MHNDLAFYLHGVGVPVDESIRYPRVKEPVP